MSLTKRPAHYTVDGNEDTGYLYYVRLEDCQPGPYRNQKQVRAILDIADDGTLAGIELIDDMPPPPSAK